MVKILVRSVHGLCHVSRMTSCLVHRCLPLVVATMLLLVHHVTWVHVVLVLWVLRHHAHLFLLHVTTRHNSQVGVLSLHVVPCGSTHLSLVTGASTRWPWHHSHLSSRGRHRGHAHLWRGLHVAGAGLVHAAVRPRGGRGTWTHAVLLVRGRNTRGHACLLPRTHSYKVKICFRYFSVKLPILLILSQTFLSQCLFQELSKVTLESRSNII